MVDEEAQEETQEETQTAESPSVADRKTAKIGYFDGEIKEVAFNEGDTLQILIDKADISFGDGQSINNDDGADVEVTDTAEEDKIYYVVGNYKQGLNI